MTTPRRGWKKRLDEAWDREAKLTDELEATYAHLRALCCGSVTTAEGWKHAVVALLPETRELGPELRQRMLDKGWGHMVERHDEDRKQAWADYGYGGEEPS